MDKLALLEQEIKILKERNLKVESSKAWETSITRKISIILITYITVVIFFFAIHTPAPFVNALVPVIGFFLSTLSVSLVKNIWIRFVYQK